MRETFEVRIADALGNHLVQIANFGSDEGAALDYILNVGQPSALTLTMPVPFDPSIFVLDGRISVWRTIGGYGPFQDGQAVYLIRKWKYTRRLTTVTCVHANSLMNRRFVLYDKSTLFADKSTVAFADDYIKQIWRENAGDLVDLSRDGVETQTNISTYVTTDPYTSSSGQSSGQFGRRGLAESIKELADSATYATGGVYLAVEITGGIGGPLVFKTYPSFRGTDRREGTSQPIIFSDEDGTLEDAELIIDRMNEVTVVSAVGAGDDDLRLNQIAIDLSRMAESPFNRIESVLDLSNIDDDVQLLNAAYAELKKGEPLIYATGTLSESAPYIRGVDYDYGDLVTLKIAGRVFSSRLDMIRTYVGYDSRTTQVILKSITI